MQGWWWRTAQILPHSDRPPPPSPSPHHAGLGGEGCRRGARGWIFFSCGGDPIQLVCLLQITCRTKTLGVPSLRTCASPFLLHSPAPSLRAPSPPSLPHLHGGTPPLEASPPPAWHWGRHECGRAHHRGSPLRAGQLGRGCLGARAAPALPPARTCSKMFLSVSGLRGNVLCATASSCCCRLHARPKQHTTPTCSSCSLPAELAFPPLISHNDLCAAAGALSLWSSTQPA